MLDKVRFYSSAVGNLIDNETSNEILSIRTSSLFDKYNILDDNYRKYMQRALESFLIAFSALLLNDR